MSNGGRDKFNMQVEDGLSWGALCPHLEPNKTEKCWKVILIYKRKKICIITFYKKLKYKK